MGTVNTTIETRALAAVKVLSDLSAVRAAYIFGSCVEGVADKWSDIDLGVFMDGVGQWDISRRATAMAIVMEKAGLDVEAHLFDASALDNPPRGGFAEYILKHGTRIFQHQ